MLTSIAGKLTSRRQKLDRLQVTSEGKASCECSHNSVDGGEAYFPPFSFFAYSFVG